MKYQAYFAANKIKNDEDLEAYKKVCKAMTSKLRSDVIILDENNNIVFEMKVGNKS